MIQPAQDPMRTGGRFRLLLLLIFLLLLFSLVIARFYIIQIDEHEKWSRKAERQHYFVIREPPLRGTFYANGSLQKGHPHAFQKLVFDIEKFHLHVDPESIPEACKSEMAEVIARLLELSIQEKSRLKEQLARKSRNRKLADWLTNDQQNTILAWWRPFARKNKIPHNALFFVADYQRSYPFGHLLGQLLHTTRNQRDDIHSHATPTGGLELYYDALLRGVPGKRRLMRSPRNAFEVGEVIATPVPGADIYLTINPYLQAIVEEEIAKGVKKSKAKAGRAVMMDPHTGEVLAIAHYPFFAPAHYQNYFNDPQLLEHTQFRALTDAVEPGSVMKAFTACAALLANEELLRMGQTPLFDPEEIIPTSDSRFPGRPLSRPLVDTRLHYYMNLNMAIQKSSNIYLARQVEKIINRLGSPWYRHFLHDRLGFGKKTGIEFPVETAGVIPTIGKKNSNGTLEWSTCTPFSLSMGYNLQINSLQLVRAYAILANGGYWVEPTFVKKIIGYSENGEKQVLLDHEKERAKTPRKRVLSQNILDIVIPAMKYTTKPGGTGPKGDIYGYTEAGKSGTSKKVINGVYKDVYRASFIGFAPVKQPAFVLFVLLDEPEFGYVFGIGKNHHGGSASSPIFSKIGKRALAYLGVAPDDPYGYPNGDPRADPAKADWAAESRQLQQTYNLWNTNK